eukprot:CAMPEP_0178373506 /NCGR_PEP_ID=MMETSP0689_2-20121128/1897_1 /TAXON_ID=160604 /ORGANISM="Amphidinium massartii, Strain CS-259" /LENGTH=362 /DNA_ID=CAMNT_0019993449 /DNA_START=75 /DNA_END=1164 /DNA_ORIENTATION=+
MAGAQQLDIMIVDAQLSRGFDNFKKEQDIFVQLVCTYDNGAEKAVGRTEVCKCSSSKPVWNERFLCGRGGGKTLKFKVFIDHMWRNQVLCGEAEFDLNSLWSRATPVSQRVMVPLYKKGDQTGALHINLALQDSTSQSTPSAAAAPPPTAARCQGETPSSKAGYPGSAASPGHSGPGSSGGHSSQAARGGYAATTPTAARRGDVPPGSGMGPDARYGRPDARGVPEARSYAGPGADKAQPYPMYPGAEIRGPPPPTPAHSAGQPHPNHQQAPAHAGRGDASAAGRPAPAGQQRAHPGQAPPTPQAARVTTASPCHASSSAKSASQGAESSALWAQKAAAGEPAPAQAAPVAGQWWNSFIDRG